jgi:hypothetical protein
MKRLIERLLNKWGYFKVAPTKTEMVIKSSVSELKPIRIMDQIEVDEFDYYSSPFQIQENLTRELTKRIMDSASKLIEYKVEQERNRGKIKFTAQLYIYKKM